MTTKTKHTPGPWLLGDLNAHDNCIPVHSETKLSELCLVCPRPFYDNNQEANAHLIAAAPELLEALIRLTSLVTGDGIPSDQYSIASELSINPQSLEAVKLAEKAINKAEGEKS